MIEPMRQLRVEDLAVEVYQSESELGDAAAANTARILRETVAKQGSARVILATGNSQLAFITALQKLADVPWSEVTVFHMDEYVGIDADHPASFRRWIRERVEQPFSPRQVHYIDGDAADAEAEAARYEALLNEAPLDLICMGIGENGHIAFNEPFQADFEDTRKVRIIELNDASIRQQVGEGHFPTPADVPRNAISLTVPALLAPAVIQVSVPEERKAPAVQASLTQPISNAVPATILRKQPHATVYLDSGSASLIGDVAVTPAGA